MSGTILALPHGWRLHHDRANYVITARVNGADYVSITPYAPTDLDVELLAAAIRSAEDKRVKEQVAALEAFHAEQRQHERAVLEAAHERAMVGRARRRAWFERHLPWLCRIL